MATRLFNSKNSMFCEKLRVVLSMKKVPYDVVDVRADERKSLLAFSNQRKVPTMDFDGQCIQDSTILAKYLEEKYPEPTIYPDNASDKGLCLMLGGLGRRGPQRRRHEFPQGKRRRGREAGREGAGGPSGEPRSALFRKGLHLRPHDPGRHFHLRRSSTTSTLPWTARSTPSTPTCMPSWRG